MIPFKIDGKWSGVTTLDEALERDTLSKHELYLVLSGEEAYSMKGKLMPKFQSQEMMERAFLVVKKMEQEYREYPNQGEYYAPCFQAIGEAFRSRDFSNFEREVNRLLSSIDQE